MKIVPNWDAEIRSENSFVGLWFFLKAATLISLMIEKFISNKINFNKQILVWYKTY